MQSEINDSMAYNPAESTLDYTTADLEEELSEILASGSDQPDTNPISSGFQKPVSPRIGDTSMSPARNDSKISPSYSDSGLPRVPGEQRFSAHGSPLGYSINTSPTGRQYRDYRNTSPLQDVPGPGSGQLNRIYPFDESSSLSQISGANSTMDSRGLSSQSSDLDILSQLEAFKIMEGRTCFITRK